MFFEKFQLRQRLDYLDLKSFAKTGIRYKKSAIKKSNAQIRHQKIKHQTSLSMLVQSM